MSEVEGTEIIEDEKIEKAPAEELVEMILSGELHAANQKFGELVEGKVIEAIEEEKHKIAQTLFEDDEDGDGDDDDVEPDDDDDDDDKEDEDEDPVGKKGKVPPQFAKKEDHIIEDLARDIEAGFKKLSSKKAKAGKSDGFEGNAIKCGDYKITPVKYHDASDTTPGADENIAFHVYVEDGKGKAVTGKINASQGADAIDFETESGKFSSSDKKTAKEIEKWCKTTSEAVEPVDEISPEKADAAAQAAYNDIRDNPSSQKAKLGTTKTAKSDAKRKRQSDKFDAYRDSKDFDKKGSKKGGAAKAAGAAGKKSDQQRHTDWRDNPADKEQGYHTSSYDPEQSFDPGEESTNVKLPENSFVAQVAKHLSGTGYIKEDLGRDIENGFKKLSNKKAKAGKQDSFEGSAIKCGDYKITPGKTHDASDTTPGADENIAFYVSVQDGSGKEVTDQIDASGGGDAIDFDTETGKMSSSDKKTAKEIEKWCKS